LSEFPPISGAGAGRRRNIRPKRRSLTEGITMAQNPPLNWLELYRSALTESDQEKLTARVGLAQMAIRERVIELARTANGSVEEKQKINSALTVLDILLK
jgi:hypothetical protein